MYSLKILLGGFIAILMLVVSLATHVAYPKDYSNTNIISSDENMPNTNIKYKTRVIRETQTYIYQTAALKQQQISANIDLLLEDDSFALTASRNVHQDINSLIASFIENLHPGLVRIRRFRPRVFLLTNSLLSRKMPFINVVLADRKVVMYLGQPVNYDGRPCNALKAFFDELNINLQQGQTLRFPSEILVPISIGNNITITNEDITNILPYLGIHKETFIPELSAERGCFLRKDEFSQNYKLFKISYENKDGNTLELTRNSSQSTLNQLVHSNIEQNGFFVTKLNFVVV